MIQLSRGNDSLAKAPADYIAGKREELAYQKDTDKEYFDPNHSQYYGGSYDPTDGKKPITYGRRYHVPMLNKPKPGEPPPANFRKGTNNLKSVYLPKPMPEEMKPKQNPDWLYTRTRGYARPLLHEPLERSRHSIPLAGKLATTSLSRFDRYQLPENNLPSNPEYAATMIPNKAFSSNISAKITRNKNYTQVPVNQRYLYNNATDTEKKFLTKQMLDSGLSPISKNFLKVFDY